MEGARATRRKESRLLGRAGGWQGLGGAVAAAERVRAGEHVIYVDFEDTASTVAGRVLALGLDEEAIAKRFHYIQPSEPLADAGWSDLQRALTAEPTLAVIDGVTEALVLHGLELKDNSDVAKWLALLPRKLTTAGIAVIQVDHVGRDRETRGPYALGAQHKQAGIDAHYSFDVARAGLLTSSAPPARPLPPLRLRPLGAWRSKKYGAPCSSTASPKPPPWSRPTSRGSA